MSPAQITKVVREIDEELLDSLIRKAARAMVQEQLRFGVTQKTACFLYDVSPNSIRELVKAGKLNVYSAGGSLPRYKISELNELFKKEL